MDSQKIVRGLLIRGMLAGLAAGVLMWLFGLVFGEPQIRTAIAFEESISPPSDEAPLVSRSMQETLGLLTGTIVYAVAIGGVFALVFAAVYGRVGHARARTTAAVLGLVAFVVIAFVPFLKYPSNPPAVSLDETIGFRTRVYFVMLLLSVVAAFAALRIGRDAVKRLGAWNGTLVAVAGYLVLIGISAVLMPAVKEMPTGFSPDVLWHFRLATVGTHVVLYETLGLALGALAERRITQATGAAGTYRTSSPSAGAPAS